MLFYKGTVAEVFQVKKLFSQSLISILISIIVLLSGYIIIFYKELYQSKNKKQELEIQKISSQYESLQQQLSPHFLFNSLNVLDALIEENPVSAQEFTRELSNIYRYVLEQQFNDLTTIKEELDFVSSYVNLMKKRFEGAVEIKILPPISLEDKVIPLSIQILIENAFKHNGISDKKPLVIEIKQEEDHLFITNNLIPKRNVEESSKKGLNNVMKRYQKLGLILSIEKTEEQFKVKIPIINKSYTIMESIITQQEEKEKRIKELNSFYKNLNTYLLTVLICLAVNLLTLWGRIFTSNHINFHLLWVVWVIVPWGVVLLSKALSLFWFPNWKKMIK